MTDSPPPQPSRPSTGVPSSTNVCSYSTATVLGLIAADTGQTVDRIFEDSPNDHWYSATRTRTCTSPSTATGATRVPCSPSPTPCGSPAPPLRPPVLGRQSVSEPSCSSRAPKESGRPCHTLGPCSTSPQPRDRGHTRAHPAGRRGRPDPRRDRGRAHCALRPDCRPTASRHRSRPRLHGPSGPAVRARGPCDHSTLTDDAPRRRLRLRGGNCSAVVRHQYLRNVLARGAVALRLPSGPARSSRARRPLVPASRARAPSARVPPRTGTAETSLRDERRRAGCPRGRGDERGVPDRRHHAIAARDCRIL